MAIKPTTQVFSIREAGSLSIDFQTGQSDSIMNVQEINTNLDTLGREVLLIQEVDFDINGDSQFGGVMARTSGSNDASDFFINGGLTVVLTEVDPYVDPNALALDSPHFIASMSITMVGGVYTLTDLNPDTATYNSVAAQDHPLFTSASDTLYLATIANYQGNDPAAGTAGAITIRGAVRVMAQRGKADADTYAAILTGLYQ